MQKTNEISYTSNFKSNGINFLKFKNFGNDFKERESKKWKLKFHNDVIEGNYLVQQVDPLYHVLDTSSGCGELRVINQSKRC